MNWQNVTIDNIATIKGGKRLPKGHDFSSTESTHLYIRARDIGCGKINIAEPVFIGENTFRYISRYTVSEDDIVVTIVGANIGDVGFISIEHSGANLTENAAKITVNKKVCNSKFLKFILANTYTKKRFQYIASGAAQGKLGLFKIKSFDIQLPPLPIQLRIADILSAYDDLIENNQRRIQLLEESARLLYKEWFVNFRFPGHENIKVVDGVPEGWEKKTLGEYATLNYGKGLKKENRIEGDYPVYGSSGVVGSHNKTIVKAPALIIGRKGNVGSVYWSCCDCWPIDTVYFIGPEESDLYLYYVLKNMTFLSTDVAVPGLNRNFAYSRSLLIPEKKIKTEFVTEISLLISQIEKLKQYTQKLAEARDFLLPRLMNGEIEV